MRQKRAYCYGIFITVFAIITALVFIDCSSGSEDVGGGTVNISDFYGTWISSFSATRIISATEITGHVSSGSWTWRNDSTSFVQNNNVETKNDYPSGFTFSGKITAKTGSIGGVGNIGDVFSQTYYLHRDKNSFCSGNYADAPIYTR